MLFNSTAYLFLFLPITFTVYFLLQRTHLAGLAKAWLVLASLFFYSYWNTSYLPIIIGSILVNFSIGTALQKSRNRASHKTTRKTVLIIGILANLGLLSYYKYTDFLLENLSLVIEHNLGPLDLLLPLAISFFTFQQIAYLVDSYQQNTQEYKFLNYCLFVTFFPQLIAGPIVHHRDMMPQFEALKSTRIYWPNIAQGLSIFVIGLFKKIVVADGFAEWANAGFSQPDQLTIMEAWATSLSYTLQLYYDFSGYSDMAIGAALLFNIRLPINFNSPYKAASIQDFWHRWHITLSNWLRDYLYIPLGGNRGGNINTYINLFLTFLIGGLWHGAGWTFVVWGAMHGSAIAIHRLWCRLGIKMHKIAGWLVTFLFINAAWVVFRAESIYTAAKIYSGMLGLNGINLSEKYFDRFSTLIGWADIHVNIIESNLMIATNALNYILIFGTIALASPNSIQLTDKFTLHHIPLKYACLIIVILAASLYQLLSSGLQTSEFLYFNF